MKAADHFCWTKENGIQLLEIQPWKAGKQIYGCFTTRVGGVSTGNFDGLQVGLHVGDQTAHILQNRSRICETIGVGLCQWVAAEQVHGDQIAIVTASDQGKGSETKESAIPACDAMITNEHGIVLTTYAADCVPLLFYSPAGVVATAHAGWKGTVQNIAGKTIQQMQQRFGCLAEEIQVAIGPSIGACCYEVDEVVYQAFAKLNLTDVLTPVEGKEELHWMCDLWLANKQLLLRAGVSDENIFVSELCTSCRTDLFFSHRKEKGKTGRFMGIVYLPEHGFLGE
ncbi:peptidoglycan editing factor PgeF [Fodinisporobacter ferrooxydans]|uniref:Purine nucleoside phosphorylase n=1 Tax=Fodinisporobacter ferrooxydans TaxID=2901836 RepID=A0ABY4CFI6_9BACL|nr:peptidoglycan editing factor PgeF [Alicyclobacillaceae bacterium MYW30-H2]